MAAMSLRPGVSWKISAENKTEDKSNHDIIWLEFNCLASDPNHFSIYKTRQLSWHVQNFVMLTLLQFSLQKSYSNKKNKGTTNTAPTVERKIN